MAGFCEANTFQSGITPWRVHEHSTNQPPRLSLEGLVLELQGVAAFAPSCMWHRGTGHGLEGHRASCLHRSLWGSYLIQGASGRTIFISGDTAYFDRYGELGEAFDIDLAVFNLGAYEPRWFMAQSHMNPAECVQAFQALRARRLLAVHWGTFRLGDDPVHLPPVELQREMKKAGMEGCLVHLEHGQSMSL